MKIVKNGSQLWENLHKTVKQPIVDLYDVMNETSGTALENYHDTTCGIQDIMDECIDKQLSMRALGSSWSFTPIAATDGIIINTRGLNSIFTINAAHVHEAYEGASSDLFFAQCGNAIWELHAYLNAKGKSLKTCGASNGQTIVGAMSTGTHGSALDIGAIQDYIVGMHIITGTNSDVYLERASYPVVNTNFVDKLNTSLIQNDELFNAALVGLGGMGFIHGVMIETEPIFLLNATMRKMAFDEDLFRLMTKLDFVHPRLPQPGIRPFQFQVMINPYSIEEGAMVTTMYKEPYDHIARPPQRTPNSIGPGDDALCFIGKLAHVAPALIPFTVNSLIGAQLKEYENKKGTLAEIFSNFEIRGKAASAAIGVDSARTIDVLKILLDLNDQHRFLGIFACRYVKKSQALLAFTKFDHTCIIELDGALSEDNLRFYEKFCEAMEAADIPFTYHWGKINSLTPERIQRMYGEDFVKFLFARNQLLKEPMLHVFHNRIFTDWGLGTAGGWV